jgi:putative ABC transport system permease protein
MTRFIPITYAARNLGRSPVRLALSVGGACAVALLAMAGAGFALGMDSALRASGHERNVILLGAGSEESVERSEIPQATAGVLAASLRGVAVHDGRPLASPEVNVALTVAAAEAGAGASTGERADVRGDARTDAKERTGLVRGITPTAFLVHPQVRLVAGRAPEPGADEVVLGTSAARAAGLAPADVARALHDDGTGGPQVLVDGRARRVVGLFAAPGTVMDGEAWMPLGDVLVLTQRDTVSAVIVALAPDAVPADVDEFAQRRIDLELSAIHEPAYYASQGAFYRPVRVMVLASAALVAAGALLGGLNTMYAAFASRVRELGMLQVLGFTRAAIVASLLQESIIAAMAGALVAVAVAIAALDGIAINFSMGTFGIRIDERVVAIGLGAGLLVGVAGCVIPAVRCLRLPLPAALKTD